MLRSASSALTPLLQPNHRFCLSYNSLYLCKDSYAPAYIGYGPSFFHVSDFRRPEHFGIKGIHIKGHVLLQVNLDEEVQNAASGNEGANGASKRGGAPPSAIPELAEAVAAQPSLRLRGVMAVAPLGADPAVSFQRLAQVAQHLTAIYPTATIISAGMSGDLEAAIAHGATHLRIGSGLLGKRPSAR